MTESTKKKIAHIAITGSIGSGKSELVRILNKRGYKTISADEIGHQLLLDKRVRDELVKVFGREILSEEVIDRKKLGGIVFPDPKALHKLNTILHPKIIDEIKKEKLKHSNEIVFFEVPLLFEAGIENLFDLTLNIFAKLPVRIKRLKVRSGFSDAEIRERFSSQLGDEFKREKADLTIDNSGTKKAFTLQLDLVLQAIEKGLLSKQS